MLVLTRKTDQVVNIADGLIRIRVLRTSNGRVRLGIEAPADIKILREEIEDDEGTRDARPAEDPGHVYGGAEPPKQSVS